MTQLLASADVVPVVNALPAADQEKLKSGSVMIGFLRPLDDPAALAVAVERGVTLFSMELVPRITRAQSMDALSSMATVAGYKAVIMAADHLPKLFPLLMTAAGTIPPARVLVLGAGVAGLQAIATARRLGAVVEAYDVRAAAGEQVKSLGAKFIEVDLGGLQTEDKGGYAKELSPEALELGRQAIAKAAKSSDIVITTAQVPGRRAPLMIAAAAVEEMRPGSIIFDLAAPAGGNCEVTKAGRNHRLPRRHHLWPSQHCGPDAGARQHVVLPQRQQLSATDSEAGRVGDRPCRRDHQGVVRRPCRTRL